MRKLFDKLTSARVAVYLMAGVALSILLSAIVPQQGFDTGRILGGEVFSESLGPVVRTLNLDRIYDSPLFLALLALLALGLLAGSVRRLAQVRRMKGAAVRIQHLSSIVFHVSLVIILAGVMLNRSFKFEGAFGLTEGQQVADDPSLYVKAASGGLRGDRYGRFQLRLDSIDLHHPAGGATTEAAELTVTQGATVVVAQGAAAVNAPLLWGDLEFHIGSLVGYSPEIIALDESGTVLRRNFVRVGGHRTDPGQTVHEDFIDGPLPGQTLNMRIDAAGSEGGDPEVILTVLEGDAMVHSGVVAVGDTLQLGRARVTVPRMRRWCYIHVVENPWVWLIFTGFWVGLAGLTLSAVARVLPPKEGRKLQAAPNEQPRTGSR